MRWFRFFTHMACAVLGAIGLANYLLGDIASAIFAFVFAALVSHTEAAWGEP